MPGMNSKYWRKGNKEKNTNVSGSLSGALYNSEASMAVNWTEDEKSESSSRGNNGNMNNNKKTRFNILCVYLCSLV